MSSKAARGPGCPIRERLRPLDAPVVVGDPSRLRGATGWTPSIPFDRTLDDLLEYWRGAVRDDAAG